MSTAQRLGRATYRLLLRLLPSALRKRYGEDMLRMFLDRQHGAVGFRLLALWSRECGALLLTALRARSQSPSTPDPHSDRGTLMAAWLHDLNTAWRALRSTPWIAAVGVATLALGIGANTAIFSVVYGVLGPLPYPGSERLATVYEDPKGDGSGRMALSVAEFLALDQDDGAFEEVAAYQNRRSSLVGGEPYPESVPTVALSHDFMDLLGFRPRQGRDFTESDTEDDAVVIVGYGFWQRRWNGDPGLVGSSITINDRAHRVIGVGGPEFDYFGGTDQLYRLLSFTPEQRAGSSGHALLVVSRRKPEVTVSAANERVAIVAERARQLSGHGGDDKGLLRLVPLYDDLVGPFRKTLTVLMGAVTVLALIACANVANLQLVQGLARRREMATHLALGARSARIIRQVVFQSVLLALLGGLAGIGLAAVSMSALRSLIADNLPRAGSIELDLGVLGFTFGLALIAGTLAGIAPAWMVSRQAPVLALKDGYGTVAGSRGAARLRGTFLVVQVSLALLLTIGAGLLVRSVVHLNRIDLGFDPEGVWVGYLALHGRPEYQDADVARDFVRRLESRIASRPQIEAVGATTLPPGISVMITEAFVAEDSISPEPVEAMMRIADPGFFAALEVRPVQGRVFSPADGRPGAVGVAVVNESFAKDRWGNGDAVGKRLRVAGREEEAWMTVIGVVPGMKATPFQQATMPGVYLSPAYRAMTGPALVVRGGTSRQDVESWVRTVVHELDQNLPVPSLRSLDAMVANTTARQRLNSALLAMFASIALLLSAVGVYGVIQYAVRQRMHEIGVRLSLGARGRNVIAMVLRQGLILALLGVGVGLLASWAASRLITSMLHGVAATDTLTYVGTSAFLLLIAAGASFLPAWRAGRVDPAITLRSE